MSQVNRCVCVYVIQVEYHREYEASRGQVTSDGRNRTLLLWSRSWFDYTCKCDVSVWFCLSTNATLAKAWVGWLI